MNYNLYNNLYSSPLVPMAKYECSPIITVEKYHIFNRKLNQEQMNDNKDINDMENFHNQLTPVFKSPDDSFLNKSEQKNKIKISLDDVKINLKENLAKNQNENLPLMQTSKFNIRIQPGEENWNDILKSLKKIEKSSSVTNIYYCNQNEMLLSKKGKRNKSPEKKKTQIKIVPLPVYEEKKFNLDEILVNGKKLKTLLKINNIRKEDDASNILLNPNINLVNPLFENNFKRLNPFMKKKSPDNFERKVNLKKLEKINPIISSLKFKKIFKKLESEIYSKINLNITDPYSIYTELLSIFKYSLENLQKDYLNKKRKMIDKYLLQKVEDSIDRLNHLIDILILAVEEYTEIKKAKSGNKKIIYYYNHYECKFCRKQFTTGQGLGGHMSRMHPNSSDHYKQKIEIRTKRTQIRQVLYLAKKELLLRYCYDYDFMAGSPMTKSLISKVINDHRDEYKIILKEMKKGIKIKLK